MDIERSDLLYADINKTWVNRGLKAPSKRIKLNCLRSKET